MRPELSSAEWAEWKAAQIVMAGLATPDEAGAIVDRMRKFLFVGDLVEHAEPREAYRLDQPRVPAGETGGGQWTDEGGTAGELPEDHPTQLGSSIGIVFSTGEIVAKHWGDVGEASRHFHTEFGPGSLRGAHFRREADELFWWYPPDDDTYWWADDYFAKRGVTINAQYQLGSARPLDPQELRAARYNPDQPRDPKGTETGGQWTDAEGRGWGTPSDREYVAQRAHLAPMAVEAAEKLQPLLPGMAVRARSEGALHQVTVTDQDGTWATLTLALARRDQPWTRIHLEGVYGGVGTTYRWKTGGPFNAAKVAEGIREILDAKRAYKARLEGREASFNPDQPRDPAGTSTGGQWAATGGDVSPETIRQAAAWVVRYSWDRSAKALPRIAAHEYLQRFKPAAPVTLYRFERADHQDEQRDTAGSLPVQSWSHNRAMVEGVVEAQNADPDSPRLVVRERTFTPDEIYTDFTRFPDALRAEILRRGGDSGMQEVLVHHWPGARPTTAAFDPDQPRDPKGSPTGGQWTSGPGPASILERIAQPDAGFTVHPVTGHEPSGPGFYAVSIFKGRERVLDQADLTVEALARFVADNQDLLRQAGNYFGGWHDPESGKIFLDVSRVVTSRAEARRLRDAHSQKAYFDFGLGRSVTPEQDAEFHDEERRAASRRDPSGEGEAAGGVPGDVSSDHGPRADAGGHREGAGGPGPTSQLVLLYDPDQPRAPKGTHEGGQWTHGPGSAGEAPRTAEEYLRGESRSGDKVLASRAQLEWTRRLKAQRDREDEQGYEIETEKDIVVGWTHASSGYGGAIDRETADKIAQLMTTAPKFQGVVWRGTESHQFDRVRAGQTLQIKQPASTTRDPRMAPDFCGAPNDAGKHDSGTILRVVLKGGLAVEAFSEFKREREVIMPRGRYRVDRVYRNGRFRVVEMREL